MVDVWLSLQLYKKNSDAELLFTDTGSLTYEIKSEDVYEEFFKHKHLFDFSNYPKNSKLTRLIKKLLVKWKTSLEFVGLKSQIYSMKNIDGKESNMAKRVNIATEFNEFKDTLFKSDIKWEEFKTKKIKWEHTKSTKYHYLLLMIKDLFWIMVFLHLLIFIKT